MVLAPLHFINSMKARDCRWFWHAWSTFRGFTLKLAKSLILHSYPGYVTRATHNYLTVSATLYCVSKKVPTFKLSVILSNLHRFSIFFALLESIRDLLQNPYVITHLTLGVLLHYLGKLKIQIFCRYSADMDENANELHFECTDFHSSTRVAVHAECIFVHKEDKVSGRLRELLK